MLGWSALLLFLVVASIQTRRSLRSQDEERGVYLRCWLCVLAILAIYAIAKAVGLESAAAMH